MYYRVLIEYTADLGTAWHFEVLIIPWNVVEYEQNHFLIKNIQAKRGRNLGAEVKNIFNQPTKIKIGNSLGKNNRF